MKTMKSKIPALLLVLFLSGTLNASAEKPREKNPPPQVPGRNTPDLAADESAKMIKRDSKNPDSRKEGQNPLENDGTVDEEIRNGILVDQTLNSVGDDFEVRTSGETVTIRGTVETAEAKRKVEDRVKLLSHGKKVQSELSVKGR